MPGVIHSQLGPGQKTAIKVLFRVGMSSSGSGLVQRDDDDDDSAFISHNRSLLLIVDIIDS